MVRVCLCGGKRGNLDAIVGNDLITLVAEGQKCDQFVILFLVKYIMNIKFAFFLD